MTTVTTVYVKPTGITLKQGERDEGKITTSVTRGPVAKALKGFGLSAIVGLVIGGYALTRINQKAERSMLSIADLKKTVKYAVRNNKKKIALLTAVVIIISMLGMTFYESNVFNVRYSYDPGFQVTSELVTSIFRRNGFKIRKMIKDGNHKDYTVDYVDERNFVLKDSNGVVVFTTVDNKNYTFQEIDRENIGKYMPMLKNTQFSVRVEGNQMRDSRDMITLAATLTYLHRKLRPVHIIGGLKLLGFTLPLLYLMKSWYDFEKISKDKSLRGDETADKLSSVLNNSTHLKTTMVDPGARLDDSTTETPKSVESLIKELDYLEEEDGNNCEKPVVEIKKTKNRIEEIRRRLLGIYLFIAYNHATR
jgi:hypothetical protein